MLDVLDPQKMGLDVFTGDSEELHSSLAELFLLKSHSSKLRRAYRREVPCSVAVRNTVRERERNTGTWVREDDGPAFSNEVVEFHSSMSRLHVQVGDPVSDCKARHLSVSLCLSLLLTELTAGIWKP